MREGHYNNSRTARTSRPSSRTLSQWMLSALTIGITSIAINQADAVNYTESWDNGGTVYNPGTTGTGYWEVATLLDGVFGTADPNTPTFQETSAEVFTVQGTGMQEVDFTFLYDDGGYHFQFGYFVVTAELLAMPTTTIADKQAWAIAALQNAEVVFVDRNYGSQPTQVWDPSIENQEWIDWHFVRPDGTSNGKTWCPGCESADIFETTYGGWVDGPPVGAPDGAQVAIADPDGNVIPGQESFTYSGVRTDANTVTKQFEGGTQIGFFIIPDNTL
jgi:hypothetical protein